MALRVLTVTFPPVGDGTVAASPSPQPPLLTSPTTSSSTTAVLQLASLAIEETFSPAGTEAVQRAGQAPHLVKRRVGETTFERMYGRNHLISPEVQSLPHPPGAILESPGAMPGNLSPSQSLEAITPIVTKQSRRSLQATTPRFSYQQAPAILLPSADASPRGADGVHGGSGVFGGLIGADTSIAFAREQPPLLPAAKSSPSAVLAPIPFPAPWADRVNQRVPGMATAVMVIINLVCASWSARRRASAAV